MDLFRKPKIGLLLIGAERFQELGEGTAEGTYKERKARETRRYLDRIGEVADVVFDEPVYTREAAQKAVDRFYNEKVDGVIASFMSWAEDFAWIRFLRELPPMPLLLVSFVRDSLSITDTNDENQFIDFLSAGALVGFQEASGSFRRFNRPMSDMTIGTLDQVMPKITAFCNASKARAVLRASKIGLLSCYNEAMWATYVDPYNIFMKIGPEIHFLSVMEMVDEIEHTDDKEIQKIVDDLCRRYEVYPNVDFEKFHASVKATYAMEQVAKKAGIDLLVLNDIDTVLFKFVGLRPGFTPLFPDEKMVTVPEGDIGGGLSTYILQMLGGRPANFIEPFYLDHQKGLIVAGHAGPNHYHTGEKNTIIARDERFAKSQWKHAGAPFAWHVFPAGIKTMLHMSEKDGKMKMVCTLVECLPTKHYLASYSHADFKPVRGTPEELFDKICKNGVTQHYGIVDGDHLDELEMLAKLCDFDFCRID
ncbi:MAG: hypothetical protein J6Z79_01265 [Clostridia bacterium]|nr:hypothetical protein [Clostridia bacterium]